MDISSKIIVIGNDLLRSLIPQFVGRGSIIRPAATISTRFENNTNAVEFLQQFLDNEAIVEYVGLILDRAFSSDVEKNRTATLVV
jgi:hypothetical protein